LFIQALSRVTQVFLDELLQTLVEGSLVSSTYEQPNGKGKKSKTTRITSWSIRADVVRKLDRNEQEPEAPASGPATESDEAPF